MQLETVKVNQLNTKENEKNVPKVSLTFSSNLKKKAQNCPAAQPHQPMERSRALNIITEGKKGFEIVYYYILFRKKLEKNREKMQ